MTEQREVTIYRGDEILCSGTLAECAEKLGVKKRTVSFYCSPAYARRIAKRKKPGTQIIGVRL